jgi:hypothetical protein
MLILPTRQFTLSHPMLDPITDSRFLPEHKLLIWHPKGVLDFAMASRTVDFLTFQERMLDEAFNRFSDWSMVSEVHINLEQINDLAAERRTTYGNGPPVKSAFLAKTFAASVVALMFSQLMKPSPIEVRAFRELGEASEWLGVPVEALQ